jgi:hypothetical protein
LVSKQDLMARVWPNVFVEPANLTVHIPVRIGIASSSTSPDAATVSSPQSLYRLTRIERNWRSTGKFG